MEKIEKTVKIVNQLGLHARAAATFVKMASKFDAEIFMTKGNNRVNAKSIMGLLMLAAGQGSQVKLEVEGTQAENVLQQLEELIERGFNEK